MNGDRIGLTPYLPAYLGSHNNDLRRDKKQCKDKNKQPLYLTQVGERTNKSAPPISCSLGKKESENIAVGAINPS